jgi:hypothetical protein
MRAPGLDARQSGYAGDVAAWRSFLACWQLELEGRSGAAPGRRESFEPSVLSKATALRNVASPATEAVALQIQSLETRLAVNLPRSYKDFLLAYRPPDYRPHLTPTGESLRIGMFAPHQVQRLQVLEPELVAMFTDPALAHDAPDKSYFVYGTDQDDAAVRTSYRADCIVVGSHGPAYYDLLVLHPQAVTADGEMEAAMLMHSGAFRAPSFAEVMRQIAHMELRRPNSVPPYPQAELTGTCADHLRPHAPWWR